MSSRVLRTAGRRFASTTAAPAPSSQPIKVLHSTSNASGAVLGNIEATWTKLPKEEQYEVYRTLEEVQKRDWKQLTVDEKKACECSIRVVHGWDAGGIETRRCRMSLTLCGLEHEAKTTGGLQDSSEKIAPRAAELRSPSPETIGPRG